MAPGDDNTIVWIYTLELDSGDLRMASEDITLSSNLYDGEIITQDSLGHLSKKIDVSNGGATGIIGNFQFSIPRDNVDAITSDFINSFYPSIGKEHITSRFFNVGIVWRGATTEAEITWLNRYYIEDENVVYDNQSFLLLETSELEGALVPTYKIQKDQNDFVSYFTGTSEELLGRTIPIIYGGFDLNDSLNEWRTRKKYGFAPTILVDSLKAEIVIASHALKVMNDTDANSNYIMEKYLDGIKEYMEVYHKDAGSGLNTSGVNDESGARFSMLPIAGGALYGQLIVQLSQLSQDSTEVNVENVINDNQTIGDTDAYYVLGQNNEVGLRVGGSTTTQDAGTFLFGVTTQAVEAILTSSDANTVNWNLRRINRDPQVTEDDSSSGTATGTATPPTVQHTYVKLAGTGTFTIEEILGQDYILKNTTGVARDLRLYNMFIQIVNINVLGIGTTYKKAKLQVAIRR